MIVLGKGAKAKKNAGSEFTRPGFRPAQPFFFSAATVGLTTTNVEWGTYGYVADRYKVRLYQGTYLPRCIYV